MTALSDKSSSMGLIIVAAGLGSRLGGLTHYRPKCLVEVNGRPILWHILKNISKFPWAEIVNVIGYRGDQIVEFYAQEFPDLNVNFVLNADYETTGCLDSLMLAPKNKAVDYWCYTNSDLLLSAHAYQTVFSSDAENCIGVRRLKTENCSETVLQKAFVVDGKVEKMDLKLSSPFNCEAVGPVKLSSKSFELIRKDWLEPQGSKPTDNRCYSAIGSRLNDFRLSAAVLSDADWAEVNTPEDLEKANKIVCGFDR